MLIIIDLCWLYTIFVLEVCIGGNVLRIALVQLLLELPVCFLRVSLSPMTVCTALVELRLLGVLRILLAIILSKKLIGNITVVLDGRLLFVLLFLVLIEARTCAAGRVSH